jgi:Cu(I)/Ag(I) efflux system membrane fusion protein
VSHEANLPASTAPPAPAFRPERRFGLGALALAALLSAALAASAALLVTRPWRSSVAAAGGDSAKPVTLYQCPMHPSIVRDHPGVCPICGMTLVLLTQEPGKAKTATTTATKNATKNARAVREDEVDGRMAVPGLATVEIDPDRQQLIGLKITPATRGPVGGAWRTVGRVAVDETRVRHINLKTPGFVERIYVDFIGKKVRKGDPLFSIYSPELLSAQEEYLLALKTQGALAKAGATVGNDGDALVMAARRKLALWDVPESEIDRLTRTGLATKTLTFFSPLAGVVTKKDVVEGMKLDAGAMPYEIVDLSSVWVLADVYESELRFMKEGMAATLRLNAFPNREFKGRAVFIDPFLDPRTRTVKVRLTFANPTGELRPEMFGEAVLHGAAHDGLRIPPDAIIDSGTDKVVFVATGEGKFQPRKVKVGESDGAFAEIISGLEVGERVVTRANFLVDSESRLRASLAEMSGASGPRDAPERARVLPHVATESVEDRSAAGAPVTPIARPPTLAAERRAEPRADHAGHRP